MSTINIKAMSTDLLRLLRGEDSTAKARETYYRTHLAPLADGGVIDWTAANAAPVRAAIKATAIKWYTSTPRCIDGVVYEPDALRAVFAPKAVKGEVYKAANRGVNSKVYRYTVGLVEEFNADAVKAKATRTAKARSEAAKGAGKAKADTAKADPAKAEQAAPLAVEQLADSLRDALAALKPQSRIVKATEAVKMLQRVIADARTAIDSLPRTASKVAKADKVAVQ